MEVENLAPGSRQLAPGPKATRWADMAAAQEDAEVVIDRLTAEYVNGDEPFRIRQRFYERQYAQLYFALVKILDVGNRPEGAPCCVLGTLYKDMALKPSILDEYTKDRGLRSALAATSFCSPSDTLSLEDEGGRMALQGEPGVLPVQALVTGIVLAVRGENRADGSFVVTDVTYPGLAPQPPLPTLQEDTYCAFISGLRLTDPGCDMLQLSMALDFLMGYAGSPADQGLAAHVARLVIAGGAIGGLDALAAGVQATPASTYGRPAAVSLQPIKDLDLQLAELCAALPVDVMPGAEDPSNVALPQQPLHRCLLPGAVRSSALVRATNPHAFSLAGVSFLGSSGQPLDDVCKYSTHADRVSAMEAALQWRHLAPTAPDTLASYPFHDSDPFILACTPHILFAGNQPAFDTRVVTGPAGQRVRLLTVPAFAKTGCLVLLNLRTLEPLPMYFKA